MSFPAARAFRPLLVVLLALFPIGASASSHDYTIGPRDILAVTVWGHADLTRDYPVDVDGTVNFPLVGRVNASGLTTSQLAAALTGLLEKDYLVNPQIFVSVKEYLSKKVIILGEADKPGVYWLTAVESSLLEMLTKAGALSKGAGRHVVLVRPRRAPGGSTNGYAILNLDLDGIQEKYQRGDPSGNIRLENEDTLFIPRVGSYFVLGEVRKTGPFSLDRPVTAFDAVMQAEGFKETAAQSSVKVLRRGRDGKQEAISLDLSGTQPRDRDFTIQSGDMLVVPKGNSFFVLGEVKSPGAYNLDGDINILQAIVRAGGFTEKASPGRTRVMRNTPKGRQVIQVDMNDVIKRGQREKAVSIMVDDVIIVPESFF